MYHFLAIKQYTHTGNQYITAPAFGSLQPVFKKIAFSFALPTIVFVGSLYSVCARSLQATHLTSNVAVYNITLHFLPGLQELGTPPLQLRGRMGCLDSHPCRHVGYRIHNRAGHPILLGYAEFDELAV